MVLGPRGAPARLTNAARGVLPSATTSALRFQSISWLNSPACRSPTLRLTPHDAWFTEKVVVSLSRDLHPATFHQLAWRTQRQLHQQCRRTEDQDGKAQGVRMLPLHAKAWCRGSSHLTSMAALGYNPLVATRSPSTEKPQTSSTSTTTNQNPTSVLSFVKCRIKTFEFHAGIVGGELPIHLGLNAVACQAATSRRSTSMQSMRRFRRIMTLSSTTFSQLPCLGV